MRRLSLTAVAACALAATSASAAPTPTGMSMQQARRITAGIAWTDVSEQPYPTFTEVTDVSCRRLAPRHVLCHYTIAERSDYQNGGPSNPRICNRTVDLRLLSRTRKPTATVTSQGCHSRFP